jgi:hypothetical protein
MLTMLYTSKQSVLVTNLLNLTPGDDLISLGKQIRGGVSVRNCEQGHKSQNFPIA